MPTIEMNYSLAMACAQDAGDRAMRAHKRTVWAMDDYNTAVAEFERLWPTEQLTQSLPSEPESYVESERRTR